MFSSIEDKRAFFFDTAVLAAGAYAILCSPSPLKGTTSAPFPPHLINSMWVYNLVSECPLGQVGSLGYVEDLVDGGFVHASAEHGPELAEDAEEGGLAAAVRAGDEEVHARLDAEIH